MRAHTRPIVAIALALMGCNPGTPQSVGEVTLLRWGQLEAAPMGLGEGRLTFRGGCVGLESDPVPAVVLWPPDVHLDGVSGALRLIAKGVAFQEGDVVTLGGGEVSDQRAKALVGAIPAGCSRDKYLLASDVVIK